MSEKEIIEELSSLVLAGLEGTLNESEFERLETLLRESKEARTHYVELMVSYVGLDAREGSRNNGCMESLLDVCSSEIEIQSSPPSSKPKRHIVRPLSLILSIAAIILFGFGLWNHWDRPLVTLEDMQNCAWDSPTQTYRLGQAWSSDRQRLTEGLLKLRFIHGSTVILEGPADFELDAEQGIKLYQGQIFASITPDGQGFTVTTPHSRFIDLGTQFGVIVSDDGTSELHVVQGKVRVDTANINEIVPADQACRIMADGRSQQSIALKPDQFVRAINSKQSILWRGQTLDLADMVGQGNGLGTGQRQRGIDLFSGRLNALDIGPVRQIPKGYRKTPRFPYVDGIFAPTNKGTNCQISSTGQVWTVPMENSGRVYGGLVLNGPWYESITTSAPRPRSANQFASISLHANMGITFDLDAIRQAYDRSDIVGFSGHCGIPDRFVTEDYEAAQIPVSTRPKADVFILVDGDTRFQRFDMMSHHGGIPFRIPLQPEDRFLSLIVTDGTDNQVGLDWILFAQPQLVMAGDPQAKQFDPQQDAPRPIIPCWDQ